MLYLKGRYTRASVADTAVVKSAATTAREEDGTLEPAVSPALETFVLLTGDDVAATAPLRSLMSASFAVSSSFSDLDPVVDVLLLGMAPSRDVLKPSSSMSSASTSPMMSVAREPSSLTSEKSIASPALARNGSGVEGSLLSSPAEAASSASLVGGRELGALDVARGGSVVADGDIVIGDEDGEACGEDDGVELGRFGFVDRSPPDIGGGSGAVVAGSEAVGTVVTGAMLADAESVGATVDAPSASAAADGRPFGFVDADDPDMGPPSARVCGRPWGFVDTVPPVCGPPSCAAWTEVGVHASVVRSSGRTTTEESFMLLEESPRRSEVDAGTAGR